MTQPASPDQGAAPAPAERCSHCHLALGSAAEGAAAEPRFCCSGCCVAFHLSVRSAGSADALLSRLVLSAFLAMGVMVCSLSLYGAHLAGSEAAADTGELASDAAHAMRGVFRMGALFLSTPVLYLLLLPLVDAVVRMRRWLSADALIVLGTSAAYAVSVWNTLTGGGEVYFETATVVLVLVTLGRWLDVRARERARAELEVLVPGRVQSVAVLRAGDEHETAPEDVRRGDLVRVRPGEVLPVDGTVVEGRAFLDTSSLTGEAEPVGAAVGARVLAGSVALDGALVLRAEAVGGERVRDEVERLLRESMGSRAAHVELADRVAAVLIPLVIALSVGTALFHWTRLGPEGALLAALSVVLISCPCALGIATPLAFWVALGRAWRGGALVRGGEVLERLARVRRMAFDKTGTLTSGELELRAVRPAAGASADEALRLAAAVELGSEHPIGRALRRAWLERGGVGSLAGLPAVEDFRARPGVGVEARVEGRALELRRAAGSAGLAASGLRAVALLEEGRELARFELAEDPRPEAGAVLRELRALDLELELLTGDAEGPSLRLARELGVAVRHSLLPADKVAAVRAAGAPTAFVGDGLNDAAALSAAEVGIAVAGGSARSLEAAGIDLMRPTLEELPALVRLARRTVRVARENLAWAFAYNAIGLGFAVTGRLNPILAAGAMVASSLAVVLNTRRLVGTGTRPAPDLPGQERGNTTTGTGERRSTASATLPSAR